jgi:hypothetical protein
MFACKLVSGKAQTRRDKVTELARLRRAEVFALPPWAEPLGNSRPARTCPPEVRRLRDEGGCAAPPSAEEADRHRLLAIIAEREALRYSV